MFKVYSFPCNVIYMFVEQNTKSASEDVGKIQLLVMLWWTRLWDVRDPQASASCGGEKEELNNRAPTSNPREQESQTQGWCAHLSLPVVVSTWSAYHSPSWRGRDTHPGGNRPVATEQPLPTTSSLYPVSFTNVDWQPAPCGAWRDALANPQMPSVTPALPCPLLTLQRPQQLAPDSLQDLGLSRAHILMSGWI